MLHQDLTQDLRRSRDGTWEAGADTFEECPAIDADLGEPSDRASGLAVHAHLPPIAFAPLCRHHLVQDLWRGAGQLLQHGADRLAHQFQPRQHPGGRQDVGGVGALPTAGLDQVGFLQPLHCEVKQTVGAAVLGEPVTEVTQDAVVEAGIVQLRGVKSARSAVPVFRPARFSGPLPAPAVRLSTQRALHKSLGFLEGLSHPVIGHGEGMTDPRYR
ncbi:hypothetical protein GCM10010446_68280 [Streptomyces enissocaesilis]|uniref:Uncharacterized protein n=1 Tax=Streptomyces enissocaesilis TaxID=332589 RepID=A0ABP6K5C5_9ACTN